MLACHTLIDLSHASHASHASYASYASYANLILLYNTHAGPSHASL